MNHISLFSGIGGFDYAAELMGWDNIAHCEINKFCSKILRYYWPKSISYEDITKTDFTIHKGGIDILTGGFPCQGNSLAGKRLGTNDDRYLWPEMLRAIDESKPTFIVGENVTGILSMEDKSGIYRDVFPKVENRKITRFLEVDHYEGIYTRQAKMLVNSICESLEERGYEVQTFAIPAAGIQAPHMRERIWFVAYASSNGYKRRGFREDRPSQSESESESERIQWERVWSNTERVSKKRSAADTNNSGLEIQQCEPEDNAEKFKAIKRNYNGWENWPTQPPICNGDDGISTGLDGITFSKWRTESIKGGGNAIVPQVVLEIFKAIEQLSNERYPK